MAPDPQAPPSGPDGAARPRWARIATAAGSLLVTVVAVLGSVGALPVATQAAPAPAGPSASASPASAGPASASAAPASPAATPGAGPSGPVSTAGAGSPASRSRVLADGSSTGPEAGRPTVRASARPAAVPADSGSGRRVVFDQAAQRVWLVADSRGHDVVRRTYLVSGSLSDNLSPGTYAVYSRSLHAVGIDDSGTMRYMVRFAHGRHAAIGFHDIPVLHGAKVQGRAGLGSPQSHGCIRQWPPDAKALWRFAPVGTAVVVV